MEEKKEELTEVDNYGWLREAYSEFRASTSKDWISYHKQRRTLFRLIEEKGDAILIGYMKRARRSLEYRFNLDDNGIQEFLDIIEIDYLKLRKREEKDIPLERKPKT